MVEDPSWSCALTPDQVWVLINIRAQARNFAHSHHESALEPNCPKLLPFTTTRSLLAFIFVRQEGLNTVWLEAAST